MGLNRDFVMIAMSREIVPEMPTIELRSKKLEFAEFSEFSRRKIWTALRFRGSNLAHVPTKDAD